MKHLYRKILLLALSMLMLAPMSWESSLMAAPQKNSAQSQRQKALQQQAKQRERQKAQQTKQREQKAKQKAREQARKDKERARAQAQKEKAEVKKEEKNEQETYRQQVEAIKKHNQRVARAATRDIHHYLGFWGYAGYSSLFQKFDATAPFSTKAVGGFGGGAGIGYQLKYRHFLLNTGVEYEHFNSLNNIFAPDGQPLVSEFSMLPYNTMTYTYTFNKFGTRTSAGFVQIPVLFGGEWGRYYFLAGPQVGLNLLGRSATSTLLTTTITDTELIDPLNNMFTHALVVDEPYNRKPATVNYQKMQFGLNVGLHAEAGLYLDEWIRPLFSQKKGQSRPAQRGGKKQQGADKWRFRLGVFADYGLINIQSSGNLTRDDLNVPVAFNDPTSPLDLTMVPMLSVEPARTAKVNPFMVGVKLAVFYELPRKQGKMLNLPPEPLPRMATMVVDSATNKPLSGAMISVYNADKDRTTTKTTNRTGLIVQKFKRGTYKVWAQRPGYFDADTVSYSHENDLQDTLVFALAQIPAPPEYYLTGFVLDSETKQPLEAMITIYSADKTQVLYDGQASDDGLFVTPLKAGTYISHMTMPGYMPQDDTISFEQDTLLLTLQHIKEGKKVILHNMFFATNKTQILPESEEALEFLATFMSENPTVEILITGHTDAVGSDAANQRLSEGRAMAVKNELIVRGISPDRIDSEGKGESEPIADNETEEGRALNRRVEITIVATGGEDISQILEENTATTNKKEQQ